LHSELQVVQRFRALPTETLWEHSRVDTVFAELNVPECLLEGSKKPGSIPFQLLQCITDDFSKKREIGRAGFGLLFRVMFLCFPLYHYVP